MLLHVLNRVFLHMTQNHKVAYSFNDWLVSCIIKGLKSAAVCLGQKKENCCDVLKRNFWKIGQSLDIYLFDFLNTQHLAAFSTIFLKKHSIWTKLDAFPTIFFIFFSTSSFDWSQSLRATQHFFFLCLTMRTEEKQCVIRTLHIYF